MREIKFQILWLRNKIDFTEEVCTHYTTLERLCDGSDKFPYNDVEIIAKRQFTGLTDQNGNEIYEGDVVSIEGDISVVRFNGGALCVDVCGMDYDYTAIGWVEYSIEVIGNIHQNPELLETSK